MSFLAGEPVGMYAGPKQTNHLPSHEGCARRDLCELWWLQSQICHFGRAALFWGSLRRPERGRTRLALGGAAGGSREYIPVSELALGRSILLVA